MKTAVAFAAGCGALCTALIWAASNLDEPFFVCLAAFTAAFWGGLAALAVWSGIGTWSERQYRSDYTTIIYPSGRR